MNADSARRLLLVQAFEQTTEPAWSAADAAWATGEARRREGGSAAAKPLLARRAGLAAQRLTQRDATIARWLDGFALPGWVLGAALGVAFAIGIALDGLGAQPRINILALPLLGVIGWNLAAYLLLASQALRSLGAAPRAARTGHGLRDALARAAQAVARRLTGARGQTPALSRFALDWAEAARPLHAARAAIALHALAAAIALGLVGGLYLRGLAFEYRAGWESTFLDAGGVHALVSVLLGPAAALLGEPLPSAAQLAALRFPASAGENAAPWIHRIALSVVLVVVLPRALLALVSLRRARALDRELPIDLGTPYFQRLLRELSGQRIELFVLPYGHRVQPPGAARLEAWLAAALGGPVGVTLAAPAAYGDAVPPAWRAAADGALPLMLFDASATPEAEVHGEFLRALDPPPTAVLIDETGLRRRSSGPDAPARVEQRRRAWRSLLEATSLEPVFVDHAGDGAGDSTEAQRALVETLRRAGAVPR
ncbi:MAG TPA: DUF2868 domain-containing protein [Methylibium sp.]|uniref:DUF2868 domain-containing protein n=1 Tax=Methylibium sp. TaxID=2067992 RepID=UPI002DBDFD7A|nr:DUF2868 domain-containing protein [Methylibium sp.]HEU4459624.1 DUF2868 domain-containing protein [Methylibium sp.]